MMNKLSFNWISDFPKITEQMQSCELIGKPGNSFPICHNAELISKPLDKRTHEEILKLFNDGHRHSLLV